MSWKKHWFALAAIVLTTATLAEAQQRFAIRLAEERQAEKEAELPSYWIGVALRDSDPSLLAHLKIPFGVLVGEVIADSPAAKAGLQPLDIITHAGDSEIKTGEDLLKAVDAAKDKEITLTIYREAKKESIKVTPAKRPEDKVAPQPPKAVEGQPREAVERALRLWKDRAKPFEFDMLGPGVVLRVEPAPLPEDMKIIVEREGTKTPKITVKQGENSWTATGEKEIDSLPEAARPHARMMLGLPTDRMFAFEEGNRTRVHAPQGGVQVLPPRASDGRDEVLNRIEAELKRLRREVEQLQKK